MSSRVTASRVFRERSNRCRAGHLETRRRPFAAAKFWTRRGSSRERPDRRAKGGDERQTEARVSAAREQGKAEAEKAAEQRAAARQAPVLAAFEALTADLAGQRHRLRTEAEHDAVKLSVAIARRILHRELAVDPEAILGLVKAAFSKIDARETHRLRVSPPDAALLREHRDRLHLPPAVEIVADGSLRAGSAIFETSRGDLDASVDTQLAEIERGLADVVRRRIA